MTSNEYNNLNINNIINTNTNTTNNTNDNTINPTDFNINSFPDINEAVPNDLTINPIPIITSIPSLPKEAFINNIEIIIRPEECINHNLVLPQYASLCEELTCLICSYMVWNPISCIVCSSPFGQKCINNWLNKNKQCPKGCKFEEAEFPKLLNRIMNNVKLYCLYKANGCNDVITYDNFYKHVNQCNFAVYRCKSPNCESKGSKQEMEKHVLNDCGNVVFKCKVCRLNIKKEYYFQHEKNPTICLNECRKVFDILESDNDRLAIRNKDLENQINNITKNNEELKKNHQNVHQNVDIIDNRFKNISNCTHDYKLREDLIINASTCSVCKKNNLSYAWCCNLCHSDTLCLICFSMKFPNTVVKCKKSHNLQPMETYINTKHVCNECRMGIDDNFTARCEDCDYDLCSRCFVEEMKKKKGACLIF